MADLPAAAIQAAAAAIERELMSGTDYSMALDSDEALARVALTAAAPLLAESVLLPLAKRHLGIEDQWGYHCGTCWVRGGSRAAWPCAEFLAIGVLLPDHPEPEVPPEAGEDGDRDR
jgi:hypothetical protein